MTVYYILFTIIIAAIAIEPHFMTWVHLQVVRFEHFIESRFFTFKLLLEIYLEKFYMKIGYIPKKYYDMAEEIRKDLGIDD